tara:strand:- start:534 stop:773 length:240 start_codon:yes stop_codon:yes gene_type:complete
VVGSVHQVLMLVVQLVIVAVETSLVWEQSSLGRLLTSHPLCRIISTPNQECVLDVYSEVIPQFGHYQSTTIVASVGMPL